jgi:DNA-binding response OmpR family regulator
MTARNGSGAWEPPGGPAAAFKRAGRGVDWREQQGRMLLLESDADERERLTEALEEAGLPVLGVSSIAEIERWPAGDVVITDVERFTSWWKEMGATHVVVIASTPEEGAAACEQGATMWVLRPCNPEQLVAAVKSILDTE